MARTNSAPAKCAPETKFSSGPKAPRGGLADKVKSWNRGFQSAFQGWVPAHDLQTFLNCRAEEMLASRIDAISRRHNHVVHQPVRAVAQLQVHLVTHNFRGSHKAIERHRNLRQIRLLPTGPCRPDGTIADAVLQSTRQTTEHVRKSHQPADARGPKSKFEYKHQESRPNLCSHTFWPTQRTAFCLATSSGMAPCAYKSLAASSALCPPPTTSTCCPLKRLKSL
jgi:hypothetical protein